MTPERKTDLIGNLVTRLEAAKILGVTPRSLDRWFWNRKGPIRFKVGRLAYYDRQEIETWLRKLHADADWGGDK
jgi:hypothetical protein